MTFQSWSRQFFELRTAAVNVVALFCIIYTVLVAIIIPKTETLALTVQQHSLLHEGPSISCSTVRSA